MELSNKNTGYISFKEYCFLESAADIKAPDRKQLEELIKKFAPFVSFNSEEGCMPVSVEWYLQKAWLVNGGTSSRIPATLTNLPVGANNANKYYLEPKEGATLLQGGEKVPFKTYVHAKVHNKTHTDLQYWFFFASTGAVSATIKWLIDDIKGHEGKINLNPLGKSSANWEKITIRVNNTTLEAEQVFFSQCGEGLWLPYSRLQHNNGRIKIYASKNGSAFYPDEGVKHSEKLRFNLFSSRLEFCFRDETGGDKLVDFAESCELISADYLGEHKPQEPLWLNFYNNWCNSKPEHLTASSVKRIVLSTFGKTLEFLLSRDILDQLVNYLLSYFTNECRYKSLTPKAVKCWHKED